VKSQRAYRIQSDSYHLAYSKTLAGMPQVGTGGDRRQALSLVAGAGWVRDAANAQVIGAVYVAMPLRRPKAICPAGEGISDGDRRSPLPLLPLPPDCSVSCLNQSVATPAPTAIGAGTARSSFAQGQDELAQLSRLL